MNRAERVEYYRLDRFFNRFDRTPNTINVPWPAREKYGEPRPTNPTIIEILGPPASGKSSALLSLQGEFTQRYPEVGLVVQPEFSVFKWNQIRDFSFQEFKTRSYLYDEIKLLNFRQGLEQAFQTKEDAVANGDALKQIVYLYERGPNDILATERAAFSADGISRKDYEEQTRSYFNFHLSEETEHYAAPTGYEIDRLLLECNMWSRNVDGIILFGVSLEEAIKRRGRGRLNNEDVRPHLELGYTWWLRNHFPWLHRQYGASLLVVNGEEDLHTNNQKVVDFVSRIVETKKQLFSTIMQTYEALNVSQGNQENS